MKKIFLCIVFSLFMASFAEAQTFSSALGGGVGYSANRSVIKNGQVVRGGAVKKPVIRKKTVIRYEPNQIELTEAQMEKLLPMIRRLQDNRTKSLEVIGIAKDYNLIYHRQTSLGRMFQSYVPHLQVRFREISGPAVVQVNNHTMEFVEYQ